MSVMRQLKGALADDPQFASQDKEAGGRRQEAGGSVVEWLERRTWNPEVPGSSPVLTTIWSCFSVAPSSTPWPRL